VILIPVIDLAGGHAVHAMGGDRKTYRPLQSSLCSGSEPLAVVTGLLGLHPFSHLYIADLDAIQGQPVQSAVLQQLQQAFPDLNLWIDAGIRRADQLHSLTQFAPVTAVLGSETLTDTRLLEQLPDQDSAILSLDFMGQSFLGPATVLATPALWPARVIVMTLDRVGKHQGPDLLRLQQLRKAAPLAAYYSAGGVRNADDLHALQTSGCAGVLLASALHDGRLSVSRLANY
jgi:phosphoribosylformimino-5-aminoimidazole carboxamide ribotide isomerase